MVTATILQRVGAADRYAPAIGGDARIGSVPADHLLARPGSAVAAALCAEVALGLRASYRHLATLHLAAGSPARAATMLRAAEGLD